MTESTIAFASDVVRALLGVAALDRELAQGESSFVRIDLGAGERFQAESFTNWGEVRVRLVELKAEATGLQEADRRRYYDDLCHSTLAFAEWRDRGMPFVARLRDFLHVPGEPASDDELDGLRGEVGAMLDAMGYHGELSRQCAEWEAANQVPAPELEGVFRAFLDETRAVTQERLMALPGTGAGRLAVHPRSGVPFVARCDYAGRGVELNVDPVHTRPGLKRLAAREGFPGHFLQLELRRALVERDETAPDLLLLLTDSADACVFEGINDLGAELIDSIETNDDRVYGLLSSYQAGLQTVAAWRLHHRGESPDEVRAWLGGRALVGGEGWVEQCMARVAGAGGALTVWPVWWGRRVVEPAWRKIHEARRPDLLRYLFGRAHSNVSVGMFF